MAWHIKEALKEVLHYINENTCIVPFGELEAVFFNYVCKKPV